MDKKNQYYFNRTDQKVQQVGSYLNDAVKLHNQIANLLQETIHYLNLVAPTLDEAEKITKEVPKISKIEPKKKPDKFDF